MAKYVGDAVIGVGLSVLAPKPLDDRTVVKNLQELYATNARYAYEGMTVANLDNGNIYMLTDKSKIGSKAGWKASYESILIQTCTEAEYKTWLANTNADFTAKDETLPFIHQDTYYYIWEDSLSAATEMDEYLKASWGKTIEDTLATKASNVALVAANNAIAALQTNLATNYATLTHVAETYVPLTFITGTEGGLTSILSSYYTKTEVDNAFVTKASLQGGLEGDDFIFVTASKYEEDLLALTEYKQSIADELATTIKSDGNGALDSLIIKQIKSALEEGQLLIVDVRPTGLYINDDKIPTTSELPKLVTLTKAEYDSLIESGDVDEETYYHVIDTNETYVVRSYLESTYSTTTQYLSYVASRYYDKTTIDQMLGAIQTGSSTALEGYYTKSEVDLTFQTKEGLTTILEDYVTKEMLGGSEGEDGDYIFVTRTTYLTDRETDATNLATELGKKVDNNSDASLKSVTATEGVSGKTVSATDQVNAPKIVNGSDSVELTEGNLKFNTKNVALEEQLVPMIVMTREEYDAMEPEDRNANAYYFLYNTDEQLALVTALELLNYYTKAQIDSKLAALKNELIALMTALGGTIPAEA